MPDALVVEDDEGWGMIPGPEFGCIHHPDNEATDDLLRLAFAWRSAEIHESAINRGLRVGDPGAAEHAHHVALTALQIETDRLHKLEKE